MAGHSQKNRVIARPGKTHEQERSGSFLYVIIVIWKDVPASQTVSAYHRWGVVLCRSAAPSGGAMCRIR